MAGKQQSSNVNMPRRAKGTVNRPFHLLFSERVYAGAPRWWRKDWEKHFNPPAGANGDRLEREPAVKKLIGLAHDWRRVYKSLGRQPQEAQQKPSLSFLITCTNLKCPLRPWSLANFGAGTWAFVEEVDNHELGGSLDPDDRNNLMERIERNLPRMAEGKDMEEVCPHCPLYKRVFALASIRKKWVYVLRGDDGTLNPHTEIYMETPFTGSMYQDYRNGAFNPERKQAFPGFFPIQQIDGGAWHFFLSPVRLGPQALSLLSHAYKQQSDLTSQAMDALAQLPTTIESGVDFTEQPWATAVTREFTLDQAKTGVEVIPLVDPFSWVGQIADLDYLPIIAARQQAIQDPREQAKAFIAATLAGEKGKAQNEHNPEQEDPWNLQKKTVEPPPEFASSGNVARAWVDHYEQALKYLDVETNYACSRVFFPVKYTVAYRIVELACQENTKDPQFLAFGLTHWAHILREMLVCEAGKSFVVWLVNNRGAANHIPRKNVLDLAGPAPAAGGVGPGLPAQVLAYLTPVLIRKSKDVEKDLRGYLGKIEVEVPMDWMKAILAPDTVKAIPDIVLDVPEKYLHHYIESFPEELEVHQFHALNGAKSWMARIQSISKAKNLLRVIALGRALVEFFQESEETEDGWERFSSVVEKIEVPVKIAEFLVDQASMLVEEGLFGHLNEVEEKIAERMAKRIYLGPYAKKLLKASNTLKALRILGVGEKILAGPVGLAMGGFELIIQTHESFESLEAGDLTAAFGHQLKAFAGGLVAVVAAVETLKLGGALIASEALAELELAWLGPVGWVAAGLMILGEIILAYGKETDFELYAEHCFLGIRDGMDGKATGFPWMGEIEWSELKDPVKARLALLRLMSGFSVWIGWYPLQREGPWWQIKTNFIPPGAYFEVEVDFWNIGKESGKVTQKAKIFPRGSGKLLMDDATGCAIQVERHPDATVIAVKITPRSLFTANQKWDDVRFEWGVRVRMVYDGVNKLPAKGWLENQHGTVSSTVNTSGKEK